MPGMARLFDVWVGKCNHPSHDGTKPMSGVIIIGSSDLISGYMGGVRVTDITIGKCGHTGIIVTGSPDCMINYLGAARCTDVVAGYNVGIIATCSPDSIVN